MTLAKRFETLQKAIEKQQDPYFRNRVEWLIISEVSGLLSVDFRGDPSTEEFACLLTLLSEDSVAAHVQRLFFHSPDVDANGTRNWDFSPLLSTSVEFPQLKRLSIELYDQTAHNHPIIGERDYEEEGMLGRWLSKAPQLTFLSAPSAPNQLFFDREAHPLHELTIQAGYDTQDFVRNFAQSNCFPELWVFEYQDYNEDYMDNYQQSCTPLSHFQLLFQSPAFESVRSFVWHNPLFTRDEFLMLKALRPRLNFQVARSSSDYVR